MNTITSKQLYNLITSGKLDLKSATSRYFDMEDVVDIIEREEFLTDLEKSTQAGHFDIVEWTYHVTTKGTVILIADLYDKYAGNYIEVLGTVSGGLSIKQFEDEIRNGMKSSAIC